MKYSTEIPVLKHADVVVVGGGPAGLGAAVAAARTGASTLLIEQNGCLGGMMTTGLVMPLAGQASKGGRSFGGIIEEFLNTVLNDTRSYCQGRGAKDYYIFSSPHIMKHVALSMLLKSKVDILLHAAFVDAITEANRIQRIIVHTKSGLVAIEGCVFIDATGDGDLIFRSGEQFVKGSEPGVMRNLLATGLDRVHEEDAAYGEYQTSGLMQPVSMMFTMGNVDSTRAEPLINRRLKYADIGTTKEDFLRLPYANTPGFMVDESDDLPLPQGRVLFFQSRREGEVTVNMTRVTGIDGTDAVELSKGEVVAQRQVFFVIDFLKRFIPGFENAYLLETGHAVGVRETRRLVGQYVLTGREAIECARFNDVVAQGSYIIDIHDPQGRRKAIGGSIHGDAYDIPYRSLVPKSIQNLLVAGRCISTDHVAHSSTRVQGTCMLTGQAAGTAAALAARQQASVGDVSVSELQTQLKKDGMVFYTQPA